MILLTGASGFVGAAVTRELVRSRRRVRTMSRTRSDHSGSALLESVAADLERPASLRTALAGVDTVVHLAGALEGTPVERMRAINVDGSRNLAIAARESGVRLMLHVSSAAVYGDRQEMVRLKETDALEPGSPYGRSKLEGERAVTETLRGSDVSLIVLRPTGVYGGARRATQQFLAQVLARRAWVHWPPRVVVHPTYVDDLVGCVLRAVDAPQLAGRVINVGGERPVSYQDWIAAAAAALGKRMRQFTVPAALVGGPARLAARAADVVGVGVPPRIALAGKGCISRAVDLCSARELLDFEPIPLTVGLERTVAEAAARGVIRA